MDSTHKIKKTWTIVKALTGTKSLQEEIHALHINGNVISDHKIIANSFNEYFSSIAEIISNDAYNKIVKRCLLFHRLLI
jgi:hypothetical protein